MKPGDEDEAWRQIVENYGDRPSVDDDVAPLPEESDSDTLPGSDADLAQPLPLAGALWDDEGHFVPPPTPPITLAEPKRLLAWAGLFGAPLVVLLGLVLPLGFPGWLTGLLVTWFAGGFVYLVATMPRGGRDPWDDGSRI